MVSRGSLAFTFLALLAVGCKKAPAAPDEGKLLAEVKAQLAARDRKLQSYSFRGQVAEAGQLAEFTFAYRSPNKMRGVLEKPGRREFSFDGQELFVLDPAQKSLVAYHFEANDEKAKVLLTQIFGPFAPDGFRAPLLLATGLTAKKVSHPKAPEAIELRQETADEGGRKIAVVWTLRSPAMDFLEKRSELDGAAQGKISVDEEKCDSALQLCVPTKLSQTGGAQTTLSEVQLNPAIPNDSFTVTPPPGVKLENRTFTAGGWK